MAGVDERQHAGAQVEPAEQRRSRSVARRPDGVLDSAAFVGGGLLEQRAPRRRVLRRLPTQSVAVSALSTPWPTASVTEGAAGRGPGCSRRCRRRRWPPAPATPTRVNEPASQVNAAGSSRRWISADRVNGVVRWPHSNRSVCRRLAITTKPARARSGGSPPEHGGRLDRQRSSSSPMASPRSVTGARTVHDSPVGRSDLHLPGCVSACSAGPPSKGSTAAAPARAAGPSAGAPTEGTWASRTSARPLRSAMRNDTAGAQGGAELRVTASTASTGAASSAASSSRRRERSRPAVGSTAAGYGDVTAPTAGRGGPLRAAGPPPRRGRPRTRRPGRAGLRGTARRHGSVRAALLRVRRHEVGAQTRDHGIGVVRVQAVQRQAVVEQRSCLAEHLASHLEVDLGACLRHRLSGGQELVEGRARGSGGHGQNLPGRCGPGNRVPPPPRRCGQVRLAAGRCRGAPTGPAARRAWPRVRCRGALPAPRSSPPAARREH